jgi:hypothetical protein
MRLIFIETPIFAAAAKGLLSDAAMRALEAELLENPRAGAAEDKTGGARKIRVALPGRGKSGGARVIYVYVERVARVYYLIAYPRTCRTR